MDNFEDILTQVLILENENKKKEGELNAIAMLVNQSKENLEEVVQNRLNLKNLNFNMVI
jgi:hypothetical protein